MQVSHARSSLFVLTFGILLGAGARSAPGQVCIMYERHELLPSVAEQGYFHTVSISGDRAVIGDKSHDGVGNASGAAFVFRRDDNGTAGDPGDDFWVEESILTASDAAELDRFGHSVSIDGDRVVAGAIYDDHAGSGSGSAYVFRRDDHGTPLDPADDFWVEEAKVTASDAHEDAWFGYTNSSDGDWIAVGAPKDDEGGELAGAVYMFRRDDQGTPSDPGDDSWIEEAKLTASDADAYDVFGWSVAISGDWTVVGAHGVDDAGSFAGAVYAFRLDDSGTPSDPSDDVWVEEAKLFASDASSEDVFGWSVSINNDRFVSGASGVNDLGVDPGKAYVFRLDDNGSPSDFTDDFWVEEAKLIASDRAPLDRFGRAVAIDGEDIVIGAQLDDDLGNASGSAYLFRRDDNGTPSDPTDDLWVEVAKLLASDGAAGEIFGTGVGVDDGVAIVGTYRYNSAYLFGVDDDCTPQICGDGLIVGAEECDDADTDDGDGCSAVCTGESGYECVGEPSVCTPICGDGFILGDEECDDAGTEPGDGCSAACALESGYECTGEPSVCQTVCGDGLIAGEEECDDGDTGGGDGCSATCTAEDGWICTGEPSACASICGDGIVVGAEQCDDADADGGDGCSASCTVETGWSCFGQPSACSGICGDGLIIGAEECDDANAEDGDGCSASCAVESGYQCAGQPSLCIDASIIPTASHWGLVVMALLLLATAKIYFGRRRSGAAA